MLKDCSKQRNKQESYHLHICVSQREQTKVVACQLICAQQSLNYQLYFLRCILRIMLDNFSSRCTDWYSFNRARHGAAITFTRRLCIMITDIFTLLFGIFDVFTFLFLNIHKSKILDLRYTVCFRFPTTLLNSTTQSSL